MRKGHANVSPWMLVTLIAALQAVTARAVPVDTEDAPDSAPDRSALIEQLLEDPLSTDSRRLVVPAIVDDEHAVRALRELQSALRDVGDLISIELVVPAIRRQLPNNANARFLHAVALAASGDVQAAETAMEGAAPSTTQERFYAAMADAMIAKARGDIARAITSARKAMELDETHPYPHNIVGQVQAAQAQWSQAEASFRRAVELGPNQVAARSNLAATLLLLDRTDESFDLYSAVLVQSPGFCPARIGRATIHEQRRAYNAAVADLEPCAQGPASDNLVRERLVNAYLLAGQPAKARELGLSLVDTNPMFARTAVADADLRIGEIAAARDRLEPIAASSSQASYLLGFCDLLENNVDAAVTRFDNVVSRAPDRLGAQLAATVSRFYAGALDSHDTLDMLAADPQFGSLGSFIAATVHAAEGDWRGAHDYWTRAEGLVPGFTFAGVDPADLETSLSMGEQRHVAMGMLYYLRQMHSAAADQFGLGVDENPDSFLAHYLKSVMHQALGQRDAAETHLLRSRDAFSGFFPVNYSLAEISLARGDVPEAIDYFESSAAVMPHPGALVRLGLLYEAEGDRQRAENAYQRFVDAYPDNYIAHNQLAWFLAKRGEKLDYALRLARRADELQPGNISINDTLGWIYFKRDDFGRALRFLETANRIADGNNPDVLFHLAAVKHAMGDAGSAKALLDEVLAKHAQFESKDDALRLQARIAASGS